MAELMNANLLEAEKKKQEGGTDSNSSKGEEDASDSLLRSPLRIATIDNFQGEEVRWYQYHL